MTNALLSTLDLSTFIDTDRYPIHQAENPKLQRIIASARSELNATGCAHYPRCFDPKSTNS